MQEVGMPPACNDTAANTDVVGQTDLRNSKSPRAELQNLSQTRGFAEDCGVQRRNVSETCDSETFAPEHPITYPLFGTPGGP